MTSSLLAAPEHFDASKYPFAAFGVVGDFSGDDQLELELEWCHRQCCDATHAVAPPDQARLIDLLGSLPFKGRQAVARNYLAKSPHCDTILQCLYDYCFQPDDEEDEKVVDAGKTTIEREEMREEDVVDEEFVLIANPEATPNEPPKPLNLNRYHIFQVVILLMAVSSGPVSAELSRRYLESSASTKFRAKILIQCVTCLSSEDFTDERLWKAFFASPDAVQKKVLEACKQSGRRTLFLRRVYKHSTSNRDNSNYRNSLIYWLESDYLLETLLQEEIETSSFPLKRWGVHGKIYVDYIRNKIEACGADLLKRGRTWRALHQRMELISLSSTHVYALLELVEASNAYVLDCSVGIDERKYLEDMSAEGEDVSSFEFVERVVLDKDILLKLTNQERLELVRGYLEARDWEKFHSHYSLVPLHKLPYKTVFANASIDDLWSKLSISESYYDVTTTQLKPRQLDPFFRIFSKADWVSNVSVGQELAEILTSWAELHLRYRPSDLQDEQRSSYCYLWSRDQVWNGWYKSFTAFYEGCRSALVSVITSEFRKSTVPSSPRLKMHAQLVQCILKIFSQVLGIVASHIGAEAALEPVLPLIIQGVKMDGLAKQSGVEGLVQQASKFLLDQVLPLLGGMIEFNPALDAKGSATSLRFFENTTTKLFDTWGGNEAVVNSIALTVLDVHARAEQSDAGAFGTYRRFCIVTDGTSSSQRFAYFNSHLKERTLDTCSRLMREILSAMKDCEIEPSSASQLWQVIKQEQELQSDVEEYLSACSLYLPDTLRDAEIASIISKSRNSILSMHKEFPNRWKDELSTTASLLVGLGLLDTVVNDESIPAQVCNALLVGHAGFANEKARQALKDATYVNDGQSRAEGLTTWLAEACKTESLPLMAEAMSFASARVKNETGFHRRIVFAWLETNFAEKVVRASLEDESGEPKGHGKLAAALVSMQKNDLNRLDSAGRMVCFHRLPTYILHVVLDFDPTRLCTRRRQLWVDCAIRLSWNFHKALGGDESLRSFSFPISKGTRLESSSWISVEAFEAAYPPSAIDKRAKLQNRIVLADDVLHWGFNPDKVFGPKQCVTTLVKAIEDVWEESLHSPSLFIEDSFPEDDGVATSLFERLEVLFNLCGTAWQEVELLTVTFDKIFSNIETSTESHLQNASRVLRLLFTIHEPAGFDVPRLAVACDKLFRHAVASEMESYVGKWFPTWKALYLNRGSFHWSNITDNRLRYFLLRHSKGCEPPACYPALTMGDRILRKCSFVRELLSMSSSALVLGDVREVLFDRRQDVLLRYASDLNALQGVFMPLGVDYDSVDKLFFNTFQKRTLLICHGSVSHRHAQFALAEAENNCLDLQSKTSAIIKFMEAPSTQHSDVLTALRSDLDEVVREALINRIFILDSPWHILGFLLSQSAIAKNDQRITSSLLGYVAQHVQVDKVVRVVDLLLAVPRRAKLSFQLHKAVIRMLFDARTDDSIRLIRAEWEEDLPDEVRNLIVENCVHRVASGESEGWEVSILSQVATDSSLESTTKFILFAPQLAAGTFRAEAVTSIIVPKAYAVDTDELLDQFRQKAPASIFLDSQPVADTFYSLLEELERSSNGSLQFLARLKKLSLSHLFVGEKLGPCDDQGALEDMLHFLTERHQQIDHKYQLGVCFLSVLFATGVCACLLTWPFPRNTAKTDEALEWLNQNDAVKKLRSCIRSQLNEALDLPVRYAGQRRMLLLSLYSILTTVQASCPSTWVYDALVAHPFESQLKILDQDVSLLSNLPGMELSCSRGRL